MPRAQPSNGDPAKAKPLRGKDGGDTYTTIKTFSYLNYSYMLKHSTGKCVSSVDYDGVPGRYYQATVTVYAAKGNGSDSRTIYASPIKAS